MLADFLESVQKPMPEITARMMNPLQLAYMGDTVHDLFVRTKLVARGEQVGRMHKRATALVSAAGQARMFDAISGQLTELEADIARRGRNANAKHAAPKNANPADYSCATGLEALWGYLYLTGCNERLQTLMGLAFDSVPEK